jgi:DNA polymerase-3 subunit delta'
VPGFDSIVDQESVVRRLSSINRKGNIPHALLFTGIEGVGKLKTAKVFAMACNCLEEKRLSYGTTNDSTAPSPKAMQITSPCGECRACRKIDAELHPDIIFVRPQKGTIKISQVRDLCHVLSMKPYEAEQRIVIISEAHAMNLEAGNALLKLLEEPPERTLLILTAPHTRNILPTIISRCQHVRFKPISQKILSSLLIDEYGIQSKEAEVLSVLANGSMNKARSLVETGWLLQRDWALSVLGYEKTDDKGLEDIGLPLALSERIARRKDQISDILDIFMTWFRDIMIYPLAPEKIINKDLMGTLRDASRHMEVSTLLSKFESVQKAREMIDSNANPRLALDVLMTRLTES